LAIVAAALGVVITMGAIGGPPEEIGQKAAYADLVTAMMALFIVLWFLSSSAEAKKSAAKAAPDQAATPRISTSGETM
jgi:chemotaxis protein MotA